MKFWFFQVLIAFDQLVNAFLGFGNDDYWADETLSSHAYRRAQEGSRRWRFLMGVINVLFLSSTHCAEAFEHERRRLDLPPELR